MKGMKKVLLAGMLAMVGIACSDYQEELDALEYRITVLEELVNVVNNELVTIKTVTDVIADGDYITDVTENDEGFIITFKSHGAIQVKHGAAGRDGQDAQAPSITVEQDPDGNWYWKLDGKWLTDNLGNRLRSNGVDGKDGKDGVDGKDGKDGKAVAPQVRINDTGIWEISTDSGVSWTSTGTPATGNDGADGNTLVTSIVVVTDPSGTYVRITLISGVTFDIPIATP